LKLRKVAVYKNEIFNHIACLIQAKKATTEWRIRTYMWGDTPLRGTYLTSSTSIHLVKWHSPSPGFVKLNFYESFTNFSVAARFIIRDWMGRLFKAGSAQYGIDTILAGKARVMRDDLKVANSNPSRIPSNTRRRQ